MIFKAASALVGLSVFALAACAPQAPQGLVFRQACSTCAVTMDYRSDRVTFTYDDNGIITRASCG